VSCVRACVRVCVCARARVRTSVHGCVRRTHVRPARASASWFLLVGCVTAEVSLVFLRRFPRKQS